MLQYAFQMLIHAEQCLGTARIAAATPIFLENLEDCRHKIAKKIDRLRWPQMHNENLILMVTLDSHNQQS